MVTRFCDHHPLRCITDMYSYTLHSAVRCTPRSELGSQGNFISGSPPRRAGGERQSAALGTWRGTFLLGDWPTPFGSSIRLRLSVTQLLEVNYFYPNLTSSILPRTRQPYLLILLGLSLLWISICVIFWVYLPTTALFTRIVDVTQPRSRSPTPQHHHNHKYDRKRSQLALILISRCLCTYASLTRFAWSTLHERPN